MKKILLLALSFLIAPLVAQETSIEEKNNIIKLNLPSIAIRNFSFQYERIINKNFSASLSYRFMPNGSMPFKNKISDLFEEDKDLEYRLLDQAKVNGMAITPEFRYYIGKRGYGRGLYVAAYYRYSKTNLDMLNISYQTTQNVESRVQVSGNLTGNAIGLMVGVQGYVSKNIVIDWWVIGVHHGNYKGILKGYSSQALTAQDQQRIIEKIDDFKYFDKEVQIDDHNVKVGLKEKMKGIRTGLSIGYVF